MNNDKINYLSRYGCLNPNPSKVKDELFTMNDFFDSRDMVQIKYEMVRRKNIDKWSAAKASRTYGFSRPSFYEIQAAFEKGGIGGLTPAKRGPKKAHKLNEATLSFINDCLHRDATLRPAQISAKVEDALGVHIHPRSIERVLSGRKKKLHRGDGKTSGF